MIKPCTISTPQFRQVQEHGWEWNEKQKCYQKMFTQSGYIDTVSWEFAPDEPCAVNAMWEGLLGRLVDRGHRVSFQTEEAFLKAKVG